MAELIADPPERRAGRLGVCLDLPSARNDVAGAVETAVRVQAENGAIALESRGCAEVDQQASAR